MPQMPTIVPGPFGSLYLKNYKTFGPTGQSLALSRINLFFGPNSSGKSSIFKAIELAVASFFGKSLSSYFYSTTVHKGKTSEQIVIGLNFRHPHRTIETSPFVYFNFSERPEDQLGVDSVVIVLPSEMELHLKPGALGLCLNDCDLSLAAFRRIVPLSYEDSSDDTLNGYLTGFKLLVAASQSPLDSLFRGKHFLTNAEEIPKDIFVALERDLVEGLYTARDNLKHLENNLVHLPPIRRIPNRSELIKLSQSSTDFLEDVETRTWEVLLRIPSSSFLTETNFWMGEHGLNLGYEILVKNEVQVTDTNVALDGDKNPHAYLVVRDITDPLMKSVDLDLTDVGAGISQVIPVIGTACVHNELWILIEQPELHLHPRVQCQLADLFIAKCKDHLTGGNFNTHNVFFIETHSEHLVLRMLRRVRETSTGKLKTVHPFALTPDDLSVFCFESNRERGAQIHQMEITEDGDFNQAWPNGFFPERLRELR
ncbi:MAG: hypothetical protein JWP89_591 [Schlesneria sp.]|nr:hypothetical protein [Schlesneria sp.]